MSQIEYLDAIINKLGYNIVERIKNQEGSEKNKLVRHIEKSLGVLVNDGVYAYYVFCISQDDPEKGKVLYTKIFITEIIEKLKNYIYPDNEIADNCTAQEFFEALSEDLHKLLFFREMLEKALIYARYHAKALGDDNE